MTPLMWHTASVVRALLWNLEHERRFREHYGYELEYEC